MNNLLNPQEEIKIRTCIEHYPYGLTYCISMIRENGDIYYKFYGENPEDVIKRFFFHFQGMLEEEILQEIENKVE